MSSMSRADMRQALEKFCGVTCEICGRTGIKTRGQLTQHQNGSQCKRPGSVADAKRSAVNSIASNPWYKELPSARRQLDAEIVAFITEGCSDRNLVADVAVTVPASLIRQQLIHANRAKMFLLVLAFIKTQACTKFAVCSMDEMRLSTAMQTDTDMSRRRINDSNFAIFADLSHSAELLCSLLKPYLVKEMGTRIPTLIRVGGPYFQGSHKILRLGNCL
jgi:hypothetical protein